MKSTRTYRAANSQMRQLGYAAVDLALHREYDPAADGDVTPYVRGVLQPFYPVELPQDFGFITSFLHLFSSAVGYAAGYYSYKWAEVLEADAFTRFRDEGVFSQQVGRDFREEILSITQDKQTGFVTISVEHYSPVVAKQWVDWIVEDVNSTIMRQDVDEAEQAIEYLNKQIQATSLAEMHNVFFRLIEEQTKTVMLAKVSPEYMFRTVDPAVAPELKAKPKRALIAALGLILGGIIGLIVVLIKNSLAPVRE